MDTLLQDIRYALRCLIRSPGFTSVAVITLALGIGATTALFSVVYGVLLKPLPFSEPERIVRVFEVGQSGSSPPGMADPNFIDLQERSHSFSGLAQFQTAMESVVGSGEPSRVMTAVVSRDFFQVMDIQPVVGRLFHADEQHEGAAPGALISHAYWQRYLDGDTALSEHSLKHGDQVVSIVGVLPPGFNFPDGAHIWTPRERFPVSSSRTALNMKVVGRLSTDTTLARARSEVSGIARQLAGQYGDDIWMRDAVVVPLHEDLVGRTRPALLMLLAAAAVLLLIACANVVNLLLARAASRQQELAVRAALGAGRWRLTRQFLGESLLLASAGGGLGVLIAYAGVALLPALQAGGLPRLAEIRIDGAVLLFTLIISLLVAAGLGVLTVWRATQDQAQTLLAGDRRATAGPGSARLRGGLIVSQVALTLVLLIGAGLLGRSLLQLFDVDPGFRTDGAVTMRLSLPWPRDEAARAGLADFHQELLSRLEAIPGLAAVGGVNSLPLASPTGANGTFLKINRPDEVIDIDDFATLSKIPERTGYAEFRVASEGYFQAMDIPLRRGRLFDATDTPESLHVAVVSEALAAEHWPDDDPIGKLIQFGNMDGDMTPFTVIGIVGDIRERNLESDPQPTFYGHYRQRPRATLFFSVVMHGAAGPSATIAQARRIVSELDPEIPPEFQTLEQLFATSTAQRRFQLVLFGAFGATALILAVIGIYGTIAYQVGQRTREIGVRVALGASGANIIGLVLRQGMLLAGLGVVLGVAGALGLGRLMQSALFAVTGTDPVTFLAVPLVLLAAVLCACYLPARRAARTSPMEALRYE